MQNFIDSATQQLWCFDDDVVAKDANGVYSFSDALGEPVQVPATLQPYVPPVLTADQIASQQAAAVLVAQAASALAKGLAISSTGTPALNGTYAVDQLSQMDIIAIETSLNAGKGFPGGAATFNYLDVAGAAHAFSEANFTDFAAAVRDFVYGCRAVVAGSSSTLPALSATIA